MRYIKNMVITGAVAIAVVAIGHGKATAQENAEPGAGVVTVFDHAKMGASFAEALANGGTSPIWGHTSTYGKSDVSVHSRDAKMSACPQLGCSHKDYTAVVIVMSGAATLEVGGTIKAKTADKFRGLMVQGGESHRVGQGDVFIMPPDTMHWYKDVVAPFRYIEVPVR